MNSSTYRHELKYIISKPEWALLRSRMMGVIPRDKHAGENGEYWVRSLYFDDYWNTAYDEKEMGVLLRHKYRIRVYNCSDQTIMLERKNKFGQYINKESAPLSRKETEALLEGEYGFLKTSEHNLKREFYYECTSRFMRPRVMVDYDREPFVMESGDVRITFDRHVRAGFGTFDLFDKALPTMEVLRADQMIMEVKFTALLPALIRRLMPPRSSMMTAASKYVLCCDAAVRNQQKNRTEGLLWEAR
jgi:hypothetical protein